MINDIDGTAVSSWYWCPYNQASLHRIFGDEEHRHPEIETIEIQKTHNKTKRWSLFAIQATWLVASMSVSVRTFPARMLWSWNRFLFGIHVAHSWVNLSMGKVEVAYVLTFVRFKIPGGLLILVCDSRNSMNHKQTKNLTLSAVCNTHVCILHRGSCRVPGSQCSQEQKPLPQSLYQPPSELN